MFTPANQEQQTKASFEPRLLVHLVRAGQDVQAIDLGPVETLNQLVQTWRQDFGQSRAASEAASELRERIWVPIERQLAGVESVFVSPDGVLGQFPLAALPGKQPGSYLLEELAINQLPVPQGLPALFPPKVTGDAKTFGGDGGTPKLLASSAAGKMGKMDEANDGFCLVGGVDYENVAGGDEPTPPTSEPTMSRPLLLAARGGQWQSFSALPGTAAEIETIERLVRQYRPAAQVNILRAGGASEASFARTAPSHRYLHIATHGFFAPESVQNALTASPPDANRMIGIDDSRAPRLVGQHPDLLSGLVFAGANHEPVAGVEDGILTAAEVQKLDLRGVELAVLSACETGLGRSAGGEGIIGLQRAFQLAGAHTTITSLWQVDDAATQALMVEFYRNLFERKLSKLDALREAQLWILNHPEAIAGRNLTTRGTNRGDARVRKRLIPETNAAKSSKRSLPAYWAAFQLSGDPQ